MSDTPRTDAAEKTWKDEYNNYRECGDPAILGVVDSDVAREMEREVTQLRARLEQSEKKVDELQLHINAINKGENNGRYWQEMYLMAQKRNEELQTEARLAELEQVYDIAAEIIGSDYRNVGVVRVALDFQTKKIAELESQLSANSNMVLVEDERHDQLLAAEVRVEECKSMVEKLEEQVRVLRKAVNAALSADSDKWVEHLENALAATEGLDNEGVQPRRRTPLADTTGSAL